MGTCVADKAKLWSAHAQRLSNTQCGSLAIDLVRTRSPNHITSLHFTVIGDTEHPPIKTVAAPF
jgi:hypothetical protein